MKNIFNIQTIIQIFILSFTLITITSCEANNKVDNEKVTDKILNMDKTLTDAIESTAEGVANAVENTAEGVANVVETAAEGVADVVETAAEGAAGMAEKSADKIESVVNSATDNASKTAQAAKDKASQMKNDVMEKTTEVKAKAVATANTTKAQVKTSASKATSQPSSTNSTSTVTTPAPTKPAVKEATTKPSTPSKPAPVGANHEAFDQLLRKHVSSSGVVDYTGFKSDMSKLDTYLESLRQNPVKSNWPKDKQLAYWINAYNANTIKLILNNYPVQKITDLEGGKPWDKVWIKLGDNTYSLNNIENDIIRPEFNEPRIHFAVNCATKSCPPLLNRAWTVANLESNFVSQTKAFVNNPQYNKISASSASLSKIFDWYGEDFGDVRTFLNKYSNTKLDAKSNLEFMEYDWNLNGK